MNPSKPQIIIDTDCGYDDLFALTLLLASPLSSQIKLITTVHGMTDPALGANTIRRLVNVFERGDINVVAGAEGGEGERRCITDYEWGRDYRDSFAGVIANLDLPVINDDDDDEGAASVDAAAEALVSILSTEEPTTILCLGPLTNLAAAIPKLPPSTDQSPDRRLVVMGGAVHCKGNMGPNEQAELNFYSAPSAAHTVLHTGGIFQSIEIADLSTANEDCSDLIASFVKNAATANTNVAAGLLKSLVEGWKVSCVYDSIVASFLFDSSTLKTKKEWIMVDGATGVTKGVEEGDGAVMVDLAMDFDADCYLGLIGGIMEGEGEEEEG